MAGRPRHTTLPRPTPPRPARGTAVPRHPSLLLDRAAGRRRAGALAAPGVPAGCPAPAGPRPPAPGSPAPGPPALTSPVPQVRDSARTAIWPVLAKPVLAKPVLAKPVLA